MCGSIRPYERAAGYASEIEAAFGVTPEPRVPCHNDLNTANWIADGDRLWLLDWEYAGMNERFFDLGALAANNELDADAEAALLVAYFGEGHAAPRGPARAHEGDERLPRGDVGTGATGHQRARRRLREYVDAHFDRLLRNASRPDYGQLLVDAASPEPTR